MLNGFRFTLNMHAGNAGNVLFAFLKHLTRMKICVMYFQLGRSVVVFLITSGIVDTFQFFLSFFNHGIYVFSLLCEMLTESATCSSMHYGIYIDINAIPRLLPNRTNSFLNCVMLYFVLVYISLANINAINCVNACVIRVR